MTSTAGSSDAEVRDRKEMRAEDGRNGQETEESQKIKPFNTLGADDNGQTFNGKGAEGRTQQRGWRMRKAAVETARSRFFRPLNKHVSHFHTETHTHTCARLHFWHWSEL